MKRASQTRRVIRREPLETALDSGESLTDPSAGDSRIYLGAILLLMALVLRLLG